MGLLPPIRLGIQRAKATDDASCFTPIQVDRVKVLTDGAVVVEPHTGIDRQPLAKGQGIGGEQSRCNEFATVDRGSAGDGLKGLPVVVDEPDTRRYDLGLTVLTFFDLRAYTVSSS